MPPQPWITEGEGRGRVGRCGGDGSVEIFSSLLLQKETSTFISDSYTCSVSSAHTLSLTGGLSLTAMSFALHSSSHG